MKTILLTGTVLLAAASLGSAAQAADSSGSYDWSGFSVGINGGAAMNGSSAKTDLQYKGTKPVEWLKQGKNSSDEDGTVATGGVSLGYDWQISNVVLGVETDLNNLKVKGEDATVYKSAYGDPTLTATNKLSYDGSWYGTLRGRAGYAFDNLLVYATGGLAYGDLKTDYSFDVRDATKSVGGNKDNGSETKFGWTAGAGVEYGFNHWSLGVEYLYVDLGSTDMGYTDLTSALNTTDVKNSVDYNFSVVRATAKLRF